MSACCTTRSSTRSPRVARAGGDAVAEVVARCRQDVALIEAALGGPTTWPPRSRRALPATCSSEVRAVVADMRARGLTVHLEADDRGSAAVPARVVMAISNAVREALSNVAAHAGTGEAWVRVRLHAHWRGTAEVPCRLQVIVRDRGTGFDPARVDQARLGLRRSIAERIADCGGQASIWSAPGRGTEVSLSWPAPGRSGRAAPGRPHARPGGPAVVSHHEVARDTAEAGLMRMVGALAVILPSLALVQVLANSRDYRQPAVAVVVWLAVLGAGAWLVPRLRTGGLATRRNGGGRRDRGRRRGRDRGGAPGARRFGER